MKRRPRAVLILFLVLAAVAVIAIIIGTTSPPPVLTLPTGTTLTFSGMSRGTQIHQVKMNETYAVDMNGHAWIYPREWPITRWQEHVHEASPRWMSERMPSTWRPRRPLQDKITAYPYAMKWTISGRFEFQLWTMTWVDKNGFESDGHVPDFDSVHDKYPIQYLGSLPPCHSPNVILRIRERVNKKPISEWPLVAELPMKNPCLLPPPSKPVMKLPASLTRDGITVTMESMTVDPNAAGSDRVTTHLALTPDTEVHRWTPTLRCFDERGAGVTWRSGGAEVVKGGFVVRTSQCFWSDGPWIVRVALQPPEDWTPPPNRQLRFSRVPLPEAKVGGAAEIQNQSGAIAGCKVVLVSLARSDLYEGSWLLTLNRSQLPYDSNFSIVVTDDKGRTWEEKSSSGGLDNSNNYRSEHWIRGEDDPEIRFLEIAVAIAVPQYFDFHVLPKFLPATRP